jgi:hypothetical protein
MSLEDYDLVEERKGMHDAVAHIVSENSTEDQKRMHLEMQDLESLSLMMDVIVEDFKDAPTEKIQWISQTITKQIEKISSENRVEETTAKNKLELLNALIIPKNKLS